MKFSHLADVHIGAWRDPAMKALSVEAFLRAAKEIIERKSDFVLISGDFFNSAVPAIDHLRQIVSILKRFKSEKIPVYIIPGSHDYSAAGKTFLDVLEEAELLISVMKLSEGKDGSQGRLRLDFTVDKKTGAKIAGLGGRRNLLEKQDLKRLDKASLEDAEGFKIFMFHTAIDELKPRELEMMESIPANLLPRGFDYYAGGHVHIVEHKNAAGYKNLVYPGPLFPASFSELWKLGRGGFYFFDDGKVEYVPVNIKNTFKIEIDAEKKSAADVQSEIETAIKQREFNNTIVLIRVAGKLSAGKPSDIDFKLIVREILARSAFYVMRNTSKLSSVEFDIETAKTGSAEELESGIIRDAAERSRVKLVSAAEDEKLMHELVRAISAEQSEGEKKYDYEARIKKDAERLLG